MNLDLFDGASPALLEDFVAVDTETTGLYPDRGDRLVEVAAVKVRRGLRADSYSQLIHPAREIPPEATRVNGITDETVAGSPPAAEVLPELASFIDESVVVCQNVPFDRAFLDMELERAGLSPLTNRMYDTKVLAKCFWPELGGFGLDQLATRAGVEVGGRHRALADAEITAGVFLALLAEAGRAGIEDLPGLEAHCRRRMCPSLSSEDWALLETAMAEGYEIEIRYPTRKGWFRLRPRELRNPYLVAFCPVSGKELTFRLDRIGRVRAGVRDP